MIFILLVLLLSAASTMLFAYSFPDFIIAPYLVSIALVTISAGLFEFIIAKKKNKNRPLLKAVITAFCFGIGFGVTVFLVNNVILKEIQSALASMIVTNMLIVSFAVFFCISLKAQNKKLFPAVLCIIITAVISLFPLSAMVKTTVLMIIPSKQIYPVYRAFVGQGGVKTDDESINFDFAYSTEKIKRTDNIGTDADFSIKLAKNEREGCQLSIVSEEDKTVSVKIGDFTNENGDKLETALFRESYLSIYLKGDIFGDEFPDALIPTDGTDGITLEKDKVQTYYIEALSTKDSPVGEYTSTVEILNEDGVCIAKTSVTAEVWNFTLPETPSSSTAIGLPGSTLFKKYGLGESMYAVNTYLTFYDGSTELTDEQEKLYKQYYDFLLEHRLCANFLPYDILDPRADEYMSDPRVTTFCIPYPKEDDAKLQEYYEKVCSNEEWKAKAYFYPVDEPFDMDRVNNFLAVTERLERLCPGYNLIVPFGDYDVTDETTGEHYTGIALEENRVNWLCPISSDLDKDYFGEWFYSRVNDNGDMPWWYVCCGPGDDTGYCNLFTFQQGLKHRLLFWQQKANNIKGFLYYDSTNWGSVDDPWTDPQTFGAPHSEKDMDAAGDGCFVYPGNKIGYDGPVGSLRLADITDGMEDFDYLTLAEEKFGREWVEDTIKKVSRANAFDYTLDDSLFEEVRISIGEALSAK